MVNCSKLIEELMRYGIDPSKVSAEEIKESLTHLMAEEFTDYKPHLKQSLFHAAGALAKQRMFMAGNRTGKTYCGVMEIAMHLTGLYPEWWKGYRFNHPIDVWAASNTGETTKNILQEENYIGKEGVRDGAIPKHLIKRATRKTGIADAIDTVFITHKSGGTSTLGFKSYDQGRLKFQGTKKHIIHFDEEPPYPVYAEALLRTMAVGDHYGMLLITMSPLMGITDMVQQFIENQAIEKVENGKFYLRATWDDNPHLLESEKKTILESLKPHEREAREKGIPSIGYGLVYPVPEDNVFIDPFDIPDHWGRFYAIDFGWSPSPTAVLFGAYDRDNDMLYYYGEYTNKELTPEQHATYLIKRGCSWIPGVYDPAGEMSSQKDGEKIVQLYRQAGMGYLSKANNSKELGIQTTLQLLRNGQMKIFNKCNQTRAEYNGYSRNDKGIPNKRNDHLMDCMRYGVMSGKVIARPKVRVRNEVNNYSHAQSWMNS